MGMFDTVWFDCPKCGKDIECQSKAGECLLAHHRQQRVPNGIAASIEGELLRCISCNSWWKVVTEAPKTTKVWLCQAEEP